MRVVVTGGRDYANAVRVFEELDALLSEHRLIHLAEGGCETGADLFARNWCKSNIRRHAMLRVGPYIVNRTYLADWDTLGKKAGPIRNGRMLRDFRPELVLAFPGGRGTADCVRQAKAMGIEVREVT